jgi:hypothetical protein
MSNLLLLVERIEFEVVKVEASRTVEVEADDAFPQIKCDFNKFEVLVRSQLDYPDTELADPVHFRFLYGIRLGKPTKPEFVAPPYCIEVEAVGYFRYVGKENHVGVERFRAVRFTGYQILYGAIREMVANLTARGPNGLWHLPGRNFHGAAKAMSEKDEAGRQEKLLQVSPELIASTTADAPVAPTKRVRKRKAPEKST